MAWKARVIEFAVLITGTTLVALGLHVFAIPNRIAAGGVGGIGIIMHYVFGLPVGGTMLALNAVLFVLGFALVGSKFGLKSILTTVLLSALVDLFAVILPFTYQSEDLFIATLFGSLLCGLGMAMIFNHGASTGGTDIVAMIMNRFLGIRIGKSLMMVDFSIAALSGFSVGSLEVSMYSLLGVLIGTYSLDMFLDSFNISKRISIVSDKVDVIGRFIQDEMNRGVTYFYAQGAYSGMDKKVLVSIVNSRQTARIRHFVSQTDPQAFMAVSNVNQVLGEGFHGWQSI